MTMTPALDGSVQEAFAHLSEGRDEALSEVWQSLSQPLHNYAFALTGSDEEADDVVGDVFLKLARRPGCLRRARNPRAYLFAMVRNAVRSRWRRRRRFVDRPEACSDPAEGPDAESLAVREAVLALPAPQRECVVLHIWGDLTFEEIGELTRVSANTAASRYRYALEKLRVVMQDEA
jgi:RNA polymerase sigma-70 factor (ECF subfamily)